MKRRDFLIAGTAVAVLPSVASAALEYTPGLVKKRLAAGETIFLDFKAVWCSTCAAQERVINALRAENPDYDAKITFVTVDWDTYRRAPVTVDRNIPRRSTLVVLKGEEELGRLVAGTSRKQIKTLMDIALNA